MKNGMGGGGGGGGVGANEVYNYGLGENGK